MTDQEKPCKCIRPVTMAKQVYPEHDTIRQALTGFIFCKQCYHLMDEHFSGVCWHGDIMLKWQQEHVKQK